MDVEGVMKLIQDLKVESTDKALVRFVLCEHCAWSYL